MRLDKWKYNTTTAATIATTATATSITFANVGRSWNGATISNGSILLYESATCVS